MGLFDLLRKLKTNNTQPQNNVNIVFSEVHLERTLDMIMKFLEAYSSVLPDEWYHLFISQEFDRDDTSTYGYLKFQIILGNWWEGLLFQYPDIDDYMKTIFAFDSQERTFTYAKFLTGTSTGNAFPKEEINTMLQKYLDNYETKHIELHFERHNWGAKLTK